jgi:hypothetical protein
VSESHKSTMPLPSCRPLLLRSTMYDLAIKRAAVPCWYTLHHTHNGCTGAGDVMTDCHHRFFVICDCAFTSESSAAQARLTSNSVVQHLNLQSP